MAREDEGGREEDEVAAARNRLSVAAAARRDQLVKAIADRAALTAKRLYAFDDCGKTFEVTFATRDSRKWVKGSLKLPAEATHACVEGDSEWTELPGSLPSAARKAAERRAVKARWQQRKSDSARHADGHWTN